MFRLFIFLLDGAVIVTIGLILYAIYKLGQKKSEGGEKQNE